MNSLDDTTFNTPGLFWGAACERQLHRVRDYLAEVKQLTESINAEVAKLRDVDSESKRFDLSRLMPKLHRANELLLSQVATQKYFDEWTDRRFKGEQWEGEGSVRAVEALFAMTRMLESVAPAVRRLREAFKGAESLDVQFDLSKRLT